MQFLNISLPIFRYLRSGCTRYFCTKDTESKLSRKSQDHSRNGGLKDPLQDDYKNFFLVDNDLKNLGMSDSDRFAVYSTIASVLHLGNIGKIIYSVLLFDSILTQRLQSFCWFDSVLTQV